MNETRKKSTQRFEGISEKGQGVEAKTIASHNRSSIDQRDNSEETDS